MTIKLWVNFDGSLVNNDYTTGATELPASTLLMTAQQFSITAPGGAWGTRNIADLWGGSGFDINPVPTANGGSSYPVRFAILVEDTGTGANRIIFDLSPSGGDGGVEIKDNDDGTATARMWNTAGTEVYAVTFNIPASGPYIIEGILNSGATNAPERLQVRAWALGGTAPAFVQTTADYAGWTPATGVAQLRVRDAAYNIGQLILSDDVTEDLSALIEQNDYSAGGDTTAPTLSNPTLTVNSNTAVTFGATSSEDGTAHAVVRLASDPAATQQEIVDGTYANAVAIPADVAITANTAYQFAQVTGLTGNTAYAVDQVATDAAGNISAISTQTFTTQSKALRLTLQGGASKTLNVVLFDAATEDTNAVLKTLANQVVSTDGSITLDLNDTSIADGSAVEGLGKDASNGDPYPLQGTVTVQ